MIKNMTILNGKTNRATPASDSIADPGVTVALIGERPFKAAACQSDQATDDTREAAIRVLAHHKWEAAGCPEEGGLGFWLEAEREVNAERAGSSSAEESE